MGLERETVTVIRIRRPLSNRRPES
jgi:hypothetical protein